MCKRPRDAFLLSIGIFPLLLSRIFDILTSRAFRAGYSPFWGFLRFLQFLFLLDLLDGKGVDMAHFGHANDWIYDGDVGK